MHVKIAITSSFVFVRDVSTGCLHSLHVIDVMSCVCPQIVAIVRIVTRCVVNVGVAVHVWANHRVKLVDYVQSVYLKTIIVVIEVTQPTLPTVLKIQILKTGKTSCFTCFLIPGFQVTVKTPELGT